LRDSIFQRQDAGAGFIENNQPLSLPLRRALIPAWRFKKAGRKQGSPVESSGIPSFSPGLRALAELVLPG